MTKAKTLSLLPGCSEHEHADWLIGPVGHHRDSDSIERSNWDVMCARYADIDPEQADHEIHRFRHWAVGWVEECAYRPGSSVAKAADEMRESLDGYAILDEMAHSMLESDEVAEAWDSWQCDEVKRAITKILLGRCSQECLDSHADDIEAAVDEMDNEDLWEIVHDMGEIYDSSLRLSKRDIERAADILCSV